MKSSKVTLRIAVVVLFCAGIFATTSCIKPPPKAPRTLNGQWRTDSESFWEGSHGYRYDSHIEFNIFDNFATLTAIKYGSDRRKYSPPEPNIWEDAISEGYLSPGDTCMRNITQSGDLKYTCEILYPLRNYTDTSKIARLQWHRASIDILYDYTRFYVDFSEDTSSITPDLYLFSRLLKD